MKHRHHWSLHGRNLSKDQYIWICLIGICPERRFTDTREEKPTE